MKLQNIYLLRGRVESNPTMSSQSLEERALREFNGAVRGMCWDEAGLDDVEGPEYTSNGHYAVTAQVFKKKIKVVESLGHSSGGYHKVATQLF